MRSEGQILYVVLSWGAKTINTDKKERIQLIMQRWNRQVFAADKIDQVKRAMKKQVVELLPKVKWSTRGVDHVLINMGSYGTVQILKVTKRPNLL